MVFLLLFVLSRARRDDVRTDRGVAGGAVSGAHPLHVDVAAVSPRQRLVRRISAEHRVRDDRVHRQHLFGTVVPGGGVPDDGVVGTFFLRETNGAEATD